MMTNNKAANILVIDDDEFIIRTTTRTLNKLGYPNVHTANSAEPAIDLLRRESVSIDLIFLDLNMSGTDGIEFIRELKHLNFSGGVVLTSADDERTLSLAETLARARDLNILGTMLKPLKVGSIQALLERWQQTQPSPSQRKCEQSQSATAAEFRAAMESGELEPWFQPKIDVTTGMPVGVELLARWNRAGSYISPAVFIPIAESAQLIDRLTLKLFHNAMSWVREWQQQGVYLHLAIKVSVRTLYDLRFSERLLRMMEDIDIALTVEVKESPLMSDIIAPLDNLLRLRVRKVGLSIGEMGIVGTNVAQLGDLPFTELKVNFRLGRDNTPDASFHSRLQQAAKTAQEYGLVTVAEGIENQEGWDLARELNFDLAQGYFLANPIPGSQIAQWAKSWRRDRMLSLEPVD